MEYTQEKLRAVQDVELEILQEVIRVCERCGIRYFAIGGTNLGAMRHDGFIPWDDDIDIGMLREDYDRFLELASSELQEGYILQWYGNEPDVPVYFAKVRKDGTRFLEPGRKNLSMHHGIFIDVMPFDKIPVDARDLEKYRKGARKWKELFIAKTIRRLTVTVPQPMRALAGAFRTVLHVALIPISKAWIFGKYDAHLRRYNDCDTTRYSSRGVKAFECDYDDLMPPQPHVFENITIMIPAHADKVLTTQYGDWHKLPPEGKRRNHEPQELSFGTSA